AVYHLAKIQIFKQITTLSLPSTAPAKLFIILQRYKFSSKSQQLGEKLYPVVAVYHLAKIQIGDLR
ncbi:MAG: hypothetical protein MJZ86_06565, partial [Bacteroidales bacterium]|nr:hypothetical protein [Bacteroidales bacterium]